MNNGTRGPKMFVLQGKVTVNGRILPARVLIDSGASQQYVSLTFANSHQLPTTTSNEKDHWVQVANGSFLQVGACSTISLRIGSYLTDVSASILDIEGFDIILGLDWLRTTNPIIDWKEMTIRVHDPAGTEHTLRPDGATRQLASDSPGYTPGTIEQISACAAIKMLRKTDA
jgi:hypothetical protein